jgi:hypothetical protein
LGVDLKLVKEGFTLPKNGIIVTLCHIQTDANITSLFQFWGEKNKDWKGSPCGIKVAEISFWYKSPV